VDRRPLATTAFLSPALVVIGVFVLVPMVLTFWISLHQGGMATPLADMPWVGLQNFQDVFANPTHRAAFVNTGFYVLGSLVITLPLALLIAMLVYTPRLRGSALLRTILFSTYVIPTVAIVIVWSQLYSPQYGPIDTALQGLGLGSPSWLSSPDTALISLVIFNVWQMLGYYVVLLVAGLTQIPTDVHEAAVLDGAGPVREAVSVTIPLLKNSLVFVVLMTIINSIQVFDPVYLLTQGGPANSTLTVSFDIQRTVVQYGLAGQASAMAASMLVIIAIVGCVVAAVLRRRAT
jgi:multiple sugar transport system permease protein